MPLFFFHIFVTKSLRMASVYRVYTALKDLVNKDQRGFVTPAVFNSLAAAAQMNIYNRLFDSAAENKRIRMSQFDAGFDKSRVKMNAEDLAVFAKSSSVALSNGIGDKPSDLGRIISMTTNGVYMFDTTTATPVAIVYDDVKMDYILRSNLSTPTNDYPVALVSSNIQVFPTTIPSVKLRYYKLPQGLNPTTAAKTVSQPKFGYTVAANKEIYSPSNSVDFELQETYFSDLVIEIAKMIGVNLRDQDIYTYASTEEKSKQ